MNRSYRAVFAGAALCAGLAAAEGAPTSPAVAPNAGSAQQSPNPSTSPGTGGAGTADGSTPPAAPVMTPSAMAPDTIAPDFSAPAVNETKEKERRLRGVAVIVGGGVEGYTGALAPRIDPGPTYGVGVQLRPTTVLGVELAYSGAVNQFNLSSYGGPSDTKGPMIIRNGGRALATLGLAATIVQP